MHGPIEDQVIDFFEALFNRLFFEPFECLIEGRYKKNEVRRQVEQSADAASQSLSRFFLNQKLSEQQVSDILEGYRRHLAGLNVEDVGNPNLTPEAIMEDLLATLPCPAAVKEGNLDPVYRAGLHSLVQVLTLVSPVMVEWGKLNFSTTFELPRRIVNRLNHITAQIDALGKSGEEAADERYELSYRDYLLQRFHRVEAGTVRMTTNLAVDLRELFVRPRLLVRPSSGEVDAGDLTGDEDLMDLAAARRFFEGPRIPEEEGKEEEEGIPALEQVKRYPRNVIVGVPGSGKSSFLEWLQLQVASVEEEFVVGGEQAIPLLLRVRNLDPLNLPTGAALIEKATASKDRATLMPEGWIQRQMENGRVLFMLDGLDETEPELRDKYVLPWLIDLCKKYLNCHFIVTSRPVGYPPNVLRKLEFQESDLLDFKEKEILEYTRHWCTAVRLARNEPGDEARREGAADGDRIVKAFETNAYIHDLARNPLMLSAICLVNYFEGGKLPEDRAVLYKLCVEGLLHNWDQRRGIHSEYSLSEKLRACREVAIAMQSEDRAEYEADKVQTIFVETLKDKTRAEKLLEHIRYRTGLLLERRPGIFAFAHLTFQEYLAALGVYEGNLLAIDPERLVKEHEDSRWHEVISLYSGVASPIAAEHLIERLIEEQDTGVLGDILGEAYLAAGPELTQDDGLRRRVLERIAVTPEDGDVLNRFPKGELAPIANRLVGLKRSKIGLSRAFRWLQGNQDKIDHALLLTRLRDWRQMSPNQIHEIFALLHLYAPDSVLINVSGDRFIYHASGPALTFRGFRDEENEEIEYESLGHLALLCLAERFRMENERITRVRKPMVSSHSMDAAFMQILRVVTKSKRGFLSLPFFDRHGVFRFLEVRSKLGVPLLDAQTWPEWASLVRDLAQLIKGGEDHRERNRPLIDSLNRWAQSIEEALAERTRQTQSRKGKGESKKSGKKLSIAKKKRKGGKS